VAERFQQQVEKHAYKLAVLTRTTVLSYRQLNRFGNRTARSILAIQGCNLQPVGILLDQYHRLIAAMLGILTISKSYVAQDAAYPEHRLRFTLKYSQTPLNITEVHLQVDLLEQRTWVSPAVATLVLLSTGAGVKK